MQLRPRHTRILQAIDTRVGTLVREDYGAYPEAESNLYLVDQDGLLVWFAELPLSNDCYSNPIGKLTSESFQCGTWKGFTCTIDLETGKLLDALLTR